jgi:hypothetical protein
MPNHVINHLEISGHRKHVQDVLDAIKGENSCIDYNSFLPMPEEIRHVTSPVRILTKKEYEKQEAKKDLTEEPIFGHTTGITKVMQKDFIERFGADNWYDWASIHWGTKWGCYDQVMGDIERTGDNVKVDMTFQTAWAGGLHAIQQLSNSFTLVSFKLTWADEDCGFNVGRVRLEEGCIIEENIPKGGSNLAMDIYFFCWGSEGWEFVDGDWKWIDDE